jgi:hypothetical protein
MRTYNGIDTVGICTYNAILISEKRLRVCFPVRKAKAEKSACKRS